MPFTKPTLTDLINRDTADLSSRMIGSDGAVLRRSILGILARNTAGASYELHGHLDWIADQVIVDTAETEILERWANIWGIRRKAAAFATGAVTITGFEDAPIPAGSVLQRQDGVLFATNADATIPVAGTIDVAVTAQAAGADGNTDADVTLTLQSPLAGVQSNAAVTSAALTNGSDTELDPSLLARLLDRIQAPPNGGSSNDYVEWALSVAGVTRAWVYPQEMGAGTVTVRFVRDNDTSIIPDSTEVAAVQDYIDSVRPVTAQVFVVAPVAKPLDMTIALSPNTPDVQAAVTAELSDLLAREAEPGGTILLSHLREAVSIAPGEEDNAISVPAADFTCATGEFATLGTLTFTAL